MKLQVHSLRYGSAPWLDLCAPTLERWCARYGYELVLWDDDHGYEVPKFVEAEMVSHFYNSDADQMLYVDADVFVHPDAPAFPEVGGLAVRTDVWHQEHNEHFREWVKEHYDMEVGNWQYVNAGVWALPRRSAPALLKAMAALQQIEFFQEQHWFNACAVITGVTDLSAQWNRYGRDWEPSWFFHLWGNTKMEDHATLREMGLLDRMAAVAPKSGHGLIHNVQHGTATQDKVYVQEFIQDAGLGNQIFEWAAGYSISKTLGIPFTWAWKPSGLREFGLKDFGIGEPPKLQYSLVFQKAGQGSRRLYELAKQKVDNSPHRMNAVSCPFQDEACFSDYADEIAERFTPSLADLPIPVGRTPIGMQVRRGDYLKHSRLNVTTPAYFTNAMKWMRANVENPHFVVVSDDPEWCRQAFGYLDDTTIMPPQDAFEGLRTLASCKGHIISNSTFGWWGAWLGERRFGGPVIVPERWHNGGNSYGDWEIVPERWHRMDIGKRVPVAVIEPSAPVLEKELPSHKRAIVYPWHADQERWHELRYSLRSIDRFFEDKECPIYILGTRKPGWLIETSRVKYIGAFTYKEALTKGVQLAEKVLWMNDDIAMLRETGWADCEVPLYLKDIPMSFLNEVDPQSNPWREGCVRILRALAGEGVKDLKVFSTHTPYVYEREKAIAVLKKYGVWEKFPMELAYFHHHGEGAVKITTEKAADVPFGDARFLNYTDRTLSQALKNAVMELLKDRPAWEIDVKFGA